MRLDSLALTRPVFPLGLMAVCVCVCRGDVWCSLHYPALTSAQEVGESVVRRKES